MILLCECHKYIVDTRTRRVHIRHSDCMINLSNRTVPGVILLWVVIALFAVFSFIIRTLPAFSGNPDVLSNVGMDDPTYHLRQIEQMLQNFPNYAWFDPMTYFPAGQPMHWGPLFTLICTAACILTGVSSRPDIIYITLFIPPLMAALLVPVVYLLVREVADWKAGIFAAFFIAIAPGQIFFRSYYGYLDHHIGEVLFGTIFCLCYLAALVYCRKYPVRIDDWETWKKPALLGLLCGITYVIGLALMPTMILFALLVGLFTPFWFMIQRYTGHLGASALVLNSVTFLVAILGFFLIGVKTEGGLNYYTIGHPIAYGMLIIGTIILFGFSWYLRSRPFLAYVGSLVLVSLLGIAVVAIVLPDLYQYLLGNAISFFGADDIHWKTIQEARQWSFADAWNTFQYGLLLFFAGIAVLVYRLRKELCPSQVFILIWSVMILYATWQHIRYEYYLAVPISILGGITISFAIDAAWDLKAGARLHDRIRKKGKDTKKPLTDHSPVHDLVPVKKSAAGLFLIAVIICGLLFAWIAIDRDLSLGAFTLNPDWREATAWMEKNTPDTGVDYYAVYDKNTWTLPDEAYGIMSWWDYGHIILYLAKRMPNANPFQYGVAGDYGAARFFVTQNESVATGILDTLKTRYVITDYEMDTGKFWAMATWDDPDTGVTPYQQTYAIPNADNPNSVTNYPLFTDAYYKTIVSRLHNFDGSMTTPGLVHYIQYVKPQYSGIGVPLVVNGAQVNSSEAMAMMNAFNPETQPEYAQALVNTMYTDPVLVVPALHHFRLIHESPSRVSPPDVPDIRYVKIFEYVPGVVIPGEGILELPVTTNTGREFVYRQESVNGSFTVPYPTGSTVGDVKTGEYRNTATGKTWTVTEEQIEQGRTIS